MTYIETLKITQKLMTFIITPYFTSKYTTFFSFDNDYTPTLELKAVTSITGGALQN